MEARANGNPSRHSPPPELPRSRSAQDTNEHHTEEFRPLVVDSVVTRLALEGRVQPDGFDEPDDDQGCRMKPDTLKVFLAAYEKRMLTLARHPGLGRRVSYRTALTTQARLMASVIAGDEATYTPFAWR
ncbi:CRISPR-associated endonuclease Cas1 [Salinactinospora qingdaonensis]